MAKNPLTLPIAAGHIVNYKGQNVVVSSVAAGADNGKGKIVYQTTLANGKVVNLSAHDTILEYGGDPGNANAPQVYIAS